VTALALLAMVHASATLSAQSSAECARLAMTLTAGSLARPDSQARAYSDIHRCPAAVRGRALAQAFDRRRQVDGLHDPRLAVFALASRDQAVFDQLQSMSGDESAAPAARVMAIAALLAMIDKGPPGASLEALTRYREGGTCFISGSPIRRAVSGGPLPTDSVRRVFRTLQKLERSRATEPMVRSAAHCALNVVRLRELGVLGALVPFSPGDLTVSHRCGNTFIIRNRSPFPYVAAIGIVGSTRRVGITIEGTRGSKSEAETWYDAGADGSVELIIDGEARYTAANSGKSCAPPRSKP
jgi:hypothetical protein